MSGSKTPISNPGIAVSDNAPVPEASAAASLSKELKFWGHPAPANPKIESMEIIRYLQNVGLPPYSGEGLEEYMLWRQTFKAYVHNAAMDVGHRLLALNNTLRGPARGVFDHLQWDLKGYMTMLERLEIDYGGEERLEVHRLNVLLDLPRVVTFAPEATNDLLRCIERYASAANGLEGSLTPDELYKLIKKRSMSYTLFAHFEDWATERGYPHKFGILVNWLKVRKN